MVPSFRNFLKSRLPGLKGKLLSQHPPNCVVILRTDMIGDHLIFGGFLVQLRQAWPKAHLVLVLPAVRRDLYDHCPCLDQLITYDYGLPGRPKAIRDELYRQIRSVKPDWIINPMFLRSTLSDRIVRYCYAPVRIGVKVRSLSETARSRHRFDRYYTHLVSRLDFTPSTSETILQQVLLSEMGIMTTDAGPQIWTSSEDAAFAKNIYSQNKLSPEKTLVYFSAASTPQRSYPGLKEIMASLLDGSSYSVIALGSGSEYTANHPPREELSSRWLNLCGQTTMAQSAEIMRYCRLVVGVDTGPMHAARAVHAPHIVLVSGMLFGRFFPNANHFSSVVVHPLNCYFCEGECRHGRPHCVTDISKKAVRRAIDDALLGQGKIPRIYLSRTVTHGSLPSNPTYAWEPAWIAPIKAEVITINADEIKMLPVSETGSLGSAQIQVLH